MLNESTKSFFFGSTARSSPSGFPVRESVGDWELPESYDMMLLDCPKSITLPGIFLPEETSVCDGTTICPLDVMVVGSWIGRPGCEETEGGWGVDGVELPPPLDLGDGGVGFCTGTPGANFASGEIGVPGTVPPLGTFVPSEPIRLPPGPGLKVTGAAMCFSCSLLK